MKFIADLHLHSKYSRATSPRMELENLAKWAKIKGIKILGTGDFTHPQWFKSLEENLEPAEPGLFKLRESKIRFLLTTELNFIFYKEGRLRKVHLLLFAPSFEAVEKINTQLSWLGNLKSDGRPTFRTDAKELMKIILNTCKDCLVVLAHGWTPWYGIFGSKSGFDSIKECLGDYSKHIHALETGLSCFDGKTEVLTDNGWKKFSEVHKSDKICTLNLENNEIEFQNPIEIFRYKYKGKMYRLETKRVDLLVTPNHKFLVSGCDFRKPPCFFLKEAKFLFDKPKQFKKDGIWIGKNEKYFTLPVIKIKHGNWYYKGFRQNEKQIPIKPWLKFFGFWIAEGWTSEGENGDYNIHLSNKDDTLLFEMKKILESFGYDVYWDKKVNNAIRVRDYQLFYYLRQFGKVSEKFVPKEIKSLSKELLKIFFEYYIKGDGHINGRNEKGLSATTTSTRLRDDLQEIALKIGMSAYYKLDRKKEDPPTSLVYKNKRMCRQKEDSWVIYFIRKNIHTVSPSAIKKYKYVESWIDFSGEVSSVAVPNHVIYVRRNGIPVWCGNSDPPMNWRLSALDKITLISCSDAHSLKNLGREASVFDTELSYRGIVGAIKSKDPKKFLYTIEFYPQEGKYHYDGHRDCGISLSPKETEKYNGICPVCGRPLTIGVLNRVEQLADRPEGFKPKDAIPFKSLVPLREIIAEAQDLGSETKTVRREYKKLIEKFGSEFNVLLSASRSDLEQITLPEIVEGILRAREGRVHIVPGYDGVYGKIRIFSRGEKREISRQKSLF